MTLFRSFILAIGLFVAMPGFSQDRFFTQFYATPLEVNPALTGAIDGTYRVSLAYHDQWRGILDNPYQTYGVFGDFRFSLGDRSKDYAGAGIAFVADRNGIFNYNTNQITVSGAFHKNLNGRSTQYLSGGFYLGILQRSVNYENLTFEDQFNGLDGYTPGTREDLPENNIATGDIGIGLNYAMEASNNFQLSGGLALAHLASPSISFFRKTDGFEDSEDATLKTRITGYANFNIGLNESLQLLPRLAVFSQGEALMAQGGANLRFSINKYNNNALHIGAGMRFAKDIQALKPSSVMALTGIELGSFMMGLSYEYSLDDLSNDLLGQGILEFTATFIGEYENANSFCPKF